MSTSHYHFEKEVTDIISVFALKEAIRGNSLVVVPIHVLLGLLQMTEASDGGFFASVHLTYDDCSWSLKKQNSEVEDDVQTIFFPAGSDRLTTLFDLAYLSAKAHRRSIITLFDLIEALLQMQDVVQVLTLLGYTVPKLRELLLHTQYKEQLTREIIQEKQRFVCRQDS